MAKIIIVNKIKDFPAELPGVDIITAKTYLSDPAYVQLKGARVFNLCRSYAYQSTGYYISLLAAARGHKVIPDITTIQDTKTQSIIRIKSEELNELIQKSMEGVEANDFELKIYFGRCAKKEFQALGQQLFYQFHAPIIKAFFGRRAGKWYLQDVDPISPNSIKNGNAGDLNKYAIEYFNARRFEIKKPSFFRYEMAILLNPEEEQPPSNKLAIKKFIKAAEGLGIGAWTIGKEDYSRLAEYDALFIRETTNVNHHTYRFARKAAVEGLVVMDDPESILKCSNKVYLAELMERNNIPTPKTLVIHKDNANDIIKNFSFPVILKLPDSCFSVGVVKVSNAEELEKETKKIFEKSDLFIAQEFLPTDFDWRIGIIDRKAIYVCKYYMARGHWQIMNWKEKGHSRFGRDEAIPLKEVHPELLNIALKAASLIGDGFYGVDIKEINGKFYLVEINDNPSIDAGVEDKYLKDELYNKIMQVFLQRLERHKGVEKRERV